MIFSKINRIFQLKTVVIDVDFVKTRHPINRANTHDNEISTLKMEHFIMLIVEILKLANMLKQSFNRLSFVGLRVACVSFETHV